MPFRGCLKSTYHQQSDLISEDGKDNFAVSNEKKFSDDGITDGITDDVMDEQFSDESEECVSSDAETSSDAEIVSDIVISSEVAEPPAVPDSSGPAQSNGESFHTQTAPIQAHALTSRKVMAMLGTGTGGLTQAQAGEILRISGPNALDPVPPPSPFTLFLNQFRETMVVILIAAAALSAWMGEYADAVIIGIIVLANAALGFYQEFKAEKSLEALRDMSVPGGKVIREGRKIALVAADIVPGDLMVFEAGDIIPADGRLVECFNLKSQEALLTGESLPVEKDASKCLDGSPPVGDMVNMVFSGTMITDGTGSAVATATGMSTQMGRIAGMIQGVQQEKTPLQRRMEELGKWLAAICITGSAIISYIAWIRIRGGASFIDGHQSLAGAAGATGIAEGTVSTVISNADAMKEAFLTGVSLAVAAIPEGLAAVITVCLAMGVQRMVRKNAVIRRLPAVETLGNATYICTDKTGTLTRNEMTVVSLWTDSHRIRVTGTGYSSEGEVIDESGKPLEAAEDSLLGHICAVCSLVATAELVAGSSESPGRKVIGDPTEASLMVLAEKSGIDRPALAEATQILFEVPFDSDRKRMSRLIRIRKSGPWGAEGTYLFCKGAPDTVLRVCSSLAVEDRIVPMDSERRDHVLAANSEMAGRALRVIGFAMARVDEEIANRSDLNDSILENGLTFLGMAGIIDPPREEVRPAIALCQRAGIRAVMITGDHKITASAIARDLGILKDGLRAVSGDEIDKLSEDELAHEVEKIAVYARVSPAHKLRIIHVLQKKGHVVGMTGDGVNDVPALKEADIGIAMGITGSDVTKQSADMILADDNFSTIVEAVREGRVIYDNILKFIRFLLASNFGEVTAMLCAIVAGIWYREFPLPLALVQILWVNLLTDGLPAIALGLDPGSSDVMDRPPRRSGESVFSQGLLPEIVFRGIQIGAGTLAVFAIVLWLEGFWGPMKYTSGFRPILSSYALAPFSGESESSKTGDLSSDSTVSVSSAPAEPIMEKVNPASSEIIDTSVSDPAVSAPAASDTAVSDPDVSDTAVSGNAAETDEAVNAEPGTLSLTEAPVIGEPTGISGLVTATVAESAGSSTGSSGAGENSTAQTGISKGTDQNSAGAILKARTAAFTTLVMFQLFYVFRCRVKHGALNRKTFLGNGYLLGAFLISLGLQFAVIYIPFLQKAFKTTDLSSAGLGTYWIVIIPIALTALIPFPFMERRRRSGDPDASGGE